MKTKLIFLLLLAVSLCSCTGNKGKSVTDEAIPSAIFVANYPLKYFTEQISDGNLSLFFPASESTDPASWQPDAEQIASIQNADLIILNGASYENWMNNISLPSSKILITSEAFSNVYITYKETTTHTHGPEGEHAHTGTAFTTWLDFSLAAKQAEAISLALAKIYPENKASYEQNYTALKTDLLKLDQELEALVNGNPERVLFSHPVYQYLQKRYGIPGSSLHWEPNQEINHDMLHELEHELDHHKAKWMVWEDEPLAASREKLEAMGIKSIVFNPCSNLPEQGDFLSVMKANIESLKSIY